MALSTYSELKTAIADWTNRSDLTTVIPQFIQLAETEINTNLRGRDLLTTVTITPSQSVNTLALPSGFSELISFVDDLGEELIEVDKSTIENVLYGTSPTRPTEYHISDVIEFGRIADDSYNYKMQYIKNLDLETDLTNDVLTKYPNLYLFGALTFAETYLKNEAKAATWAQLFQRTLDSANRRENRSTTKLKTNEMSASRSGRYNINKH